MELIILSGASAYNSFDPTATLCVPQAKDHYSTLTGDKTGTGVEIDPLINVPCALLLIPHCVSEVDHNDHMPFTHVT